MLYNTNKTYNYIVKRTFIEFIRKIYDNKKIIISYFDIEKFNLINNNYLTIDTKQNKVITIKGNKSQDIYNKIKYAIYMLRIDFKIGELVTDKKPENDWICNICLENNHNDLIELRCCKNILHKSCFYTFLQNNKLFNCPICRNTKCILCLGKGC